MSVLSTGRRSVVAHLLRRVAPFSVIDSGARLAAEGAVVECSRSGPQIKGIVRADQGTAHSIHIEMPGGDHLDGRCTCSSVEEMQEQWCPHAVAVLLRAADLGFTDPDSGFAPTEPRSAPRSPVERLAEALAQLTQSAPSDSAKIDGPIECRLGFRAGHCLLQLDCDGVRLEPRHLENNHRPFKREIYNVIVRTLEDVAQWSDEEHVWSFNSGEGISVVLALLSEHDQILHLDDSGPLHLSPEPIDAHLSILWRADGADIGILWVLPDGSTRPYDEPPVGAGPTWTLLDRTIYQLTPRAQALTQALPGDGGIFIQKSKMGPLLVALSSVDGLRSIVRVERPELQPETSVIAPSIALTIEKSERASDHFASQQQLELRATISFDYPAPPPEQNVVYLPDRQREDECFALLTSLGFQNQGDHRTFYVRGDPALDLLYSGPEALPADWKISGLTQLRRSLKFANLSVKVSLGDSGTTRETTSERTDWFDCSVTLLQNNSPVPLASLFKNARVDSDRWVRLDSGAYARVPGGGLNQLKTTLGLLDMNFKLSSGISTRISPAQAISLARYEDEQIEVQSSQRIKSLTRKLKDFTAITPVKLSKEFHGKLRHYQHEGVNWMNFLSDFSLGGILADEMGLGKTVQALAFLQSHRDRLKKEKRAHEPSLVVAPTSVITNWAYEARRFTPNLKVLLLHGPNRKEHFSNLHRYDIVITSYALLRLDRFDLEKVQFNYVILDEAQNIKNPQAATTMAAKSMKSRHRLALTGTPTENRPLELWSILDFLMPGYLGSSDFFRSYIEKPILELGPQAPVTRLLNQRTRPFILRRAKAEVEKDLPPKIESVLHVDMTESQRQLYNQIIADVRPKVFDAVSKKGMRGASVSILAALLRLRQVCNHPNSIDSLREVHGFDSGKFTLLKDLLTEALESGRKILLFCQFIEMLQIIKRWLEQSGVHFLYLDGATKDRQALVDQFNSDDGVRLFLISLKAGGTGLNLTAADTVVIYDPWWNPAVEHQAVDRAHRIGQKKTVSVYRLVTENSVEQKIMDLKNKKSKIVDALIHEPGLSTINLSKTDLEALFEPVEPLAIAAAEGEAS